MNSICMLPGSALQVGKPITPILQVALARREFGCYDTVMWLLLNRRVDDAVARTEGGLRPILVVSSRRVLQ
jgi:hypothetical protein